MFTAPPKSVSRLWEKKSNLTIINRRYKYILPWLVWLSGLSAGLRTKGSLAQFPVRTHAWVADQVCSGGCTRANQLHIDVSPSLPLSKNNFFKKVYPNRKMGQINENIINSSQACITPKEPLS